MMYKFFSALILLLLFSCSTTKQMTIEERLEQAETLAYRGDILQAESIYLDILTTSNPAPQQAVQQLSQLYVDTNQTSKAIELLTKYKDEPSTKNFTLSALGYLYRETGEYDQSIEHYKLYMAMVGEKNPNYQKAQKAVEELQYLKSLLVNKYDITPVSVTELNTSDPEYLPSFTIDQSTIVFTRMINNQEDLYEATFNREGTYGIRSMSEINTRYNEGAQSISGDGRTLVFTHCNEDFGYGSCDLYISHKEQGGWSKPKNIGKPINTRYWESSPSLSTDGQTLYFSSNRPEGVGESDIWVSKKAIDGWTNPKNLGDVINSSGKESSPFIHSDNQTLYFRSDGHLGLGGYDVFMSRRGDTDTWSTPINLGAPINTISNDGDLIVRNDGKKAYFSSDKIEKGNLDIYQFDLPIEYQPTPLSFIRGTVISSSTRNPIPAELTITNLSTQEKYIEYKVDSTGLFLVAVPLEIPLSIHVNHPGYQFYSDNVYYQSDGSNDVYEETIALTELEDISNVDKPSILKNIFFESNSAKLLPESEIEIDYLYDLMMSNNDYLLTIFGHTDNVGTDTDNVSLSQSRAEAVKDALVQKGIVASRIQAIGKGETEPIADNNSEIGRAQNRRTEFIISTK